MRNFHLFSFAMFLRNGNAINEGFGWIPVYVGVRRTQFKIKSINYKSLFVQNKTNSANIKNHLKIRKTFHCKMNHSEA